MLHRGVPALAISRLATVMSRNSNVILALIDSPA